jgi:hypothetical protein
MPPDGEPAPAARAPDVVADRVSAVPGKRDLEHALRAAGLTARQAKRLLSRGYTAIARDDERDELEEMVAKADELKRSLVAALDRRRSPDGQS